MQKVRKLVGTALICALHPAFSAPVVCSYGYQDSSCTPAITAAPQAAPTCSTAAGWTTAAAATWIGSQYTAPQCNYQAPPSCPSGDITTSAASWNGSAWVGLGCQAPVIIPTYSDQCTAQIPAGYMFGQIAGFNPNSWNNPSFTPGGYAYGLPRTDTVYAAALYGPPVEQACGDNGQSGDYIAYCGINPSGWFDQMIEVAQVSSSGACNH
jgi:hypothetical protein